MPGEHFTRPLDYALLFMFMQVDLALHQRAVHQFDGDLRGLGFPTAIFVRHCSLPQVKFCPFF
jgi:hypothetical protein